MKVGRVSRDALLAAGLFSFGILSRLPFRSQILYHWDSVNFALGMEHFDVYLHQPHPPGYILYVMLGRLVNLLICDNNASLVWISTVATGLAAVAVFCLGQSVWERRTGIVAALLLLSSPLFWFHGEVALSYMIEAVLVTLVVLLCFHHLIGKDDRLWLSAFVLAIAGGFRQNTVLFLLPLWAAVAWRFRWRRAILALVVLVLTCVAWLLPMLALTGGVERYWEAVGAASQEIGEESSLLDVTQAAVNGTRLMVFTGYALCIGLLPLILGALHWAKRHLREWRSWLQRPRVQLFLWWILPSLVFYFFIHIRQPGHSFTFMPGVLLLTAVAIGRLADCVGKRWHCAVYSGLTVGVVLVNILFFFAAPSALFGSPRLLLSTPSWRSIQRQDSYVGERVSAIRARFSPQSTAVLAAGRSFRYPDYYLRDYQYTSMSHSPLEGHRVLEGVDTVVLFDSELLDRVSEAALTHSLSLSSGDVLNYVSCSDGEVIVVGETIDCQRQE
jgi:4-amino-4-deoxy-L-arabinose transferase-like glycosyltransferase